MDDKFTFQLKSLRCYLPVPLPGRASGRTTDCGTSRIPRRTGRPEISKCDGGIGCSAQPACRRGDPVETWCMASSWPWVDHDKRWGVQSFPGCASAALGFLPGYWDPARPRGSVRAKRILGLLGQGTRRAPARWRTPPGQLGRGLRFDALRVTRHSNAHRLHGRVSARSTALSDCRGGAAMAQWWSSDGHLGETGRLGLEHHAAPGARIRPHRSCLTVSKYPTRAGVSKPAKSGQSGFPQPDTERREKFAPIDIRG